MLLLRPAPAAMYAWPMSSRTQSGAAYRWHVLALFWVTYLLNQADRQVIFSVFPLLRAELGLSNVQLGLLGSTFQWVFAAMVPIAGALADATNRKQVIVAALLVWSAATAGSGFVAGFGLLLL